MTLDVAGGDGNQGFVAISTSPGPSQLTVIGGFFDTAIALPGAGGAIPSFANTDGVFAVLGPPP